MARAGLQAQLISTMSLASRPRTRRTASTRARSSSRLTTHLSCMASISRRFVWVEGLRPIFIFIAQRDINATDGVHDNTTPSMLPGALEHFLPEIFDEERILAQQEWF